MSTPIAAAGAAGGSPTGDPKPAPPATTGDEVKATLNRLHEENERLTGEVRKIGGAFGRVRKELGLSDEATDGDVLQTLSRLKTPPEPKPSGAKGKKPAGTGKTEDNADDGGGLTEQDLKEAVTQAARVSDERHGKTITDLSGKVEKLSSRLHRAYRDFEITKLCEQLGLNSTLAIAVLDMRTNGLDWSPMAIEEQSKDGEDSLFKVRPVDRKHPDREFYSTEMGKHPSLEECMAELAKRFPGVVLATPQSGTGAGQGSRRGPTGLRKDPSQMSELEKVSVAFGPKQ